MSKIRMSKNKDNQINKIYVDDQRFGINYKDWTDIDWFPNTINKPSDFTRKGVQKIFDNEALFGKLVVEEQPTLTIKEKREGFTFRNNIIYSPWHEDVFIIVSPINDDIDFGNPLFVAMSMSGRASQVFDKEYIETNCVVVCSVGDILEHTAKGIIDKMKADE